MSYIRALPFACFLISTGASPAPVEILDPNGPRNPTLEALADPLDARGIDIILGRAADFEPGDRPRLALLTGFRTDLDKVDWGTVTRNSWAYGFDRGVVGAIVAVRDGANPRRVDQENRRCENVSAETADVTCAFIRAWLSAAHGTRVFVAFTRDDQLYASRVAEALRANGYTVFIYLRSDGIRDPWADPDLVGEVFAQADHRLVIDSRNARGSEGVAFERLVCEQLLVGPPPRSRWREFLTGGS